MPILLLTVYCLLTVAASLAGGLLPIYIRLTHRRMQMALSFVSGVMLGVAVLHLLPHAWAEFAAGGQDAGEPASLDAVAGWLLGGFLAMFLLERFFSFHQHEVEVRGDGVHAPAAAAHHGHDHDDGHPPRHALSWGGAFLGLTVHSVLNGVALAASVATATHGEHEPAALLGGLGVFLVIVLHKPFDALTIGTLMAAGGRSRSARHAANVLFALMVPAGAAAFYLGLEAATASAHLVIGATLALSAGMFLCIALSDLLPELQFHQHDRVKLTLALLAGLAVAWSVGLFEGEAHEHDHGHDRTTPPAHQHE